MKKTPLCAFHEKSGAKMQEFAGYFMPIEYVGINEEHRMVREQAGIFDVSHMGDIWVKGPKALEFLQRVSSNDVSALQDGQVQYACFPNEQGGIIDDFLTYRMNENEYLLVVNAANLDKDWAWLCKQGEALGMKVEQDLVNASDAMAQVAVQGPLAMKVVQKLVGEPVEDMKYYTFRYVTLAGVPNVILSITGYTGAGGCEIYCASGDVEKIWNAVLEAGKEEGLKPAGLGARDTLRLEMGFCLYGHDINETTSPIAAGLGWITKLTDNKKDMVARSLIEKVKADGPVEKLVGFEMIDKGIPRQHYPIVDAAGNTIGEVTSGTMSPSLKLGIGMGYVKKEFSKTDTEIFIQVRGKNLKAKVVKLPFYKK